MSHPAPEDQPDDGSPPGEDLDDHAVDEAALDAELAEAEQAQGDLGVSLRALLEPPGDIEQRTADGVDRSLHGRSALSLGMDLLGLGWLTITTILTDDLPPADGVPEGIDDED